MFTPFSLSFLTHSINQFETVLLLGTFSLPCMFCMAMFHKTLATLTSYKPIQKAPKIPPNGPFFDILYGRGHCDQRLIATMASPPLVGRERVLKALFNRNVQRLQNSPHIIWD
jgi:hypothetical protein